MIVQLNQQIERFSGLDWQWLAFPRALEERFEADTAPRRAARVALEGLLAIFLFDLCLVADHLISPALFWHAAVIRLGFFTPLALLVNYGAQKKLHRRFREPAIAAVTCVAGILHLYLERNQTAVNSAYAQAGLIAVIVYANTSVRLRFPYALAASAVMVAGDLFFLRSNLLLEPNEKLLGLALTLVTVAVTLIANYSANREERLNYLLGLRGDLLLRDLHDSNEKLASVAETDGLTGLANRIGFDLKFEQAWNNACARQLPFSIVMVDVDHFKETNDHYGHLYGDKVLQRIARLLHEALRREDDFAARFGGEEFVILLPNTAEPEALLVADRLRRVVEVAGFPPIDPTLIPLGPISATVSCGVATTLPRTPDERHRLLHAADKALYDAKAAGRNCVCTTPYKPAEKLTNESFSSVFPYSLIDRPRREPLETPHLIETLHSSHS